MKVSLNQTGSSSTCFPTSETSDSEPDFNGPRLTLACCLLSKAPSC